MAVKAAVNPFRDPGGRRARLNPPLLDVNPDYLCPSEAGEGSGLFGFGGEYALDGRVVPAPRRLDQLLLPTEHS